MRSVRLEAAPATAEDRLRRRYTPEQREQLAWHLYRHRDLASRLSEAALDEAVVSTDTSPPREIARRVLQVVSLL